MKKKLFKIVSLFMLSIFLIGSTTSVANAATNTFEEMVVNSKGHGLFTVYGGAKIKYDVHGIQSVEPVLYSVGMPVNVKLVTLVINRQTTHTVDATIYYKVDGGVHETGHSINIYFKSPLSHSGGGRDW